MLDTKKIGSVSDFTGTPSPRDVVEGPDALADRPHDAVNGVEVPEDPDLPAAPPRERHRQRRVRERRDHLREIAERHELLARHDRQD